MKILSSAFLVGICLGSCFMTAAEENIPFRVQRLSEQITFFTPGNSAPPATMTVISTPKGLIVIDTPHDLSFFGQLVVLLLIQAGGLNIMVLSTFAALLVGRGLGLRGERALGAVLDLGILGIAWFKAWRELHLVGFIFTFVIGAL